MTRYGPVLAAAAIALAPSAANWRYSAEIPDGGEGYVKIPVTAEIFRAARPGLSDIRLFDGRGAEVGYAVRRSGPPPPPRAVPLRVAAYDRGPDEISILLEAETGTAEAPRFPTLEAVEVSTPARDFILPYRLEGRRAEGPWRLLASGAIFDRSAEVDLRSTTIGFPAAALDALRLTFARPAPGGGAAGGSDDLEVDYGDLRLSLRRGDPDRIRFDAFTGRSPAPAGGIAIDRVRVPVGPAVPAQEGEESIYPFDGGNIPATSIDLAIGPGLFHRRVVIEEEVDSDLWREVARGQVYRFSRGGATAESTTISLPGRPLDRARLRVEGGARIPIDLRAVTLVWPQTWIVAVRRDGMRLLVGGPEGEPPRYDIDRYAEKVLDEAATVRAGPLEENPVYRPDRGWPVRRILAAASVALSLGLLCWTAILLRRSPPGGSEGPGQTPAATM